MTNRPLTAEEIESALSTNEPVSDDARALHSLVRELRSEAPTVPSELRTRVASLSEPARAHSPWRRVWRLAAPVLAPALAAAALVVGFWPTSSPTVERVPTPEALSAKGPARAVPSRAEPSAPVGDAAAAVAPSGDAPKNAGAGDQTTRQAIAISLGVLSLAVVAVILTSRNMPGSH